ncbi:MAG: adenylate/guanylate cyclase domain-containing protein [Pseudomonadota bacterium]
MKVRLRIGIVTLFFVLVVPLTGLMVGALHLQNARLATDTARAAMDRATTEVVGKLRGMLMPITRAVDQSVENGRRQGRGLVQPEAWFSLFAALEMSPEAYSLYYGFADGDFLQIVRLPPAISKFGPHGQRPPPEARYVVRQIAGAGGQRADTYRYMARWGDVVRTEAAPAITYDPRQRPWFKAASDHDEVANSGIYIFSGTGGPGLTLSRRITDSRGGVAAVFGADVSLDTLAAVLAANRVGREGRIFILDEDGRVIVHSDGPAVRREGDKLVLVKAERSDAPLVAEAVALRERLGDSFRAAMGPGGATYLVSFSAIPAELKRDWTIAVVADEDEFVGPIRRASLMIFLVGAAFLLFVGMGIMLAARNLTAPIAGLIEETVRIRRFDLDGPVAVDTPVLELHDLAAAIGAMKAALRSFGAFVPKEVVRAIVDSGSESVVGGARQAVTIMFTDLKGFTAAAEQLEPEEVLRRLSGYFEVMSTAIHAHGGTIDKYIGDAIMAMWNAPVRDPHHEISACRGALACHRANAAHNERLAELYLPPLITRIGLHSDMAVVGNVGSSDRMQYTALGSAVNLAARVEGLNKFFGTDLLVTEAIEEAARGHFLFRTFGQVVPAGASLSIGLFELMDDQEPGAAERCEAWNAAFAIYAAGRWAEAEHAFTAFLDRWPGDEAGRLFRARVAAFRDDPPGPDWDGSLVVDSK